MTTTARTLLGSLIALSVAACSAQASINSADSVEPEPPVAEPAPVEEPAPPPAAEPAPAPEEKDATLEGDEIKIKKRIRFATNSAEILEDSNELMDNIAQVMKDNPQVKKVRVIGHTDVNGDAAANKKLSEARAASVVQGLRDRGVETELMPIGRGEEKPVCKEDTEECHQRNRRVQFKVAKD